MTKPQPDRLKKPPRDERSLADPQEGGPGHENDGGESLLSGRSREDDAHEVEEVEIPPHAKGPRRFPK